MSKQLTKGVKTNEIQGERRNGKKKFIWGQNRSAIKISRMTDKGNPMHFREKKDKVLK